MKFATVFILTCVTLAILISRAECNPFAHPGGEELHNPQSSQMKDWSCAKKGEQCGKTEKGWVTCCRSFTACNGKTPTDMICEH